MELRRHPVEGGALPEGEAASEAAMRVELAYDLELPLVATNDVYFPKAAMYEAHDAMICIAEGSYVDQSTPRRAPDRTALLQVEAEMATLFADLPEALDNTVEIANRCAFAAYKRKPILPKIRRRRGAGVAPSGQ